MAGYMYIGGSVADKSEYKSIDSAYQRGDFDVVVYSGVFWVQGDIDKALHNRVISETKRYYPELKHIQEV